MSAALHIYDQKGQAKTMARAKSKTAPTPPAPEMPWASPGTLDRAAGRGYGAGQKAHYLYHMPGAYYAVDGWCVPQLSQLWAGEAGVNGVDAVRSRDGKSWVADPEPAIVSIQRKGGRIIPHDVDAADGHASYLVPVPGTNTWTHRLSALVPGMRPRPPAPAQRAAWLRSLMDRGVIDAPHPEEVRAVGQKLRALYEANKRNENETTDGMAVAWQLYQERALVEQVKA